MVALTHWVCFLFSFEEDSLGSGSSSRCGISADPSFGSFPVCWRVANVTTIPKGPRSPWASNYRPISLTPILCKVFERLLSVRLGRFMECRGVLLTTQFAYRKGLGTSDDLLCVAHTVQSAWRWGRRLELFRSISMPLLTGSTIRDRKSTRLNSSHSAKSRMPSSA